MNRILQVIFKQATILTIPIIFIGIGIEIIIIEGTYNTYSPVNPFLEILLLMFGCMFIFFGYADLKINVIESKINQLIKKD